jgi:mandelate racemase
MTARIRGVRARPVDLVPDRPTETAAGTMATTPIVLVDVHTDEGVVGHAYLRSYASAALRPLAQLVENLGALLDGVVAAPATVESLLRDHLRLLGTEGLAGHAIAGIDMAVWDALAKAHQVPLVVLLGGECRPVPAYASLRTMSPAAAAEEAERAAARGFAAVKVKVGRGRIDDDVAAIRAVRRAVGDAAAVMVDYNQCLTVPEAIRRVRVLDDEGLYWIEEPTRAADLAGHARIAAAAATPVQLGENWSGPGEMARSLAAAASDHATVDVMKMGGVTGWLRAAALAEVATVPVSSHAFGEVSAHLLAVTPTAHWLEYLDHAAALLTEPMRVDDGHVVIPDRPGNGLAWNEAYLTRHA